MRKPAHKTKLVVNRETIRVLNKTELARAAGGEEVVATGARDCVIAVPQVPPALTH
jgi:hypothetical protein